MFRSSPGFSACLVCPWPAGFASWDVNFTIWEDNAVSQWFLPFISFDQRFGMAFVGCNSTADKQSISLVAHSLDKGTQGCSHGLIRPVSTLQESHWKCCSAPPGVSRLWPRDGISHRVQECHAKNHIIHTAGILIWYL
jgi:hypothetical protein